MNAGATTLPIRRVAVVGCGQWGHNLVRNFHALGALAAICDASPGRVRDLQRKYDVPVLSFEEVLGADRIDGVVLATPAATHATLAIRALEAGKHVFIEKPLALTVADGERIGDIAEATKRILMVGHLLHYHSAFLKLNELVADGKLGRLLYIYSNRLNLGQFRREEDVFWSFAPHDISMILALVGDVPDTVEAVGHCYLHNSIADVTTTHVRFANGVNCQIFVSWLHPFKEQKLVVVGDHGMAVFDDREPWSRKLVVYPHQVAWRHGVPEPARAEVMLVPLQQAEPLQMECEHFLECMREGKRPRTDARNGIEVLRVLEAARCSMQSGRPTDLREKVARIPYFAHDTACIDEGCRIGAGTRIWHFTHILDGSELGRNCVIGQNVMIGPDVTVGAGCKIQNNVSIYNGVVLEDDVFCGPSCVFTNVNNPRAHIERKDELRSTLVGRGATIGANATIVCGHNLGRYCFVAAGAVVTRDVPDYALVAGNPARQIGWVSRAGERLGSDLVCPRTSARYELDDQGRLTEIVGVLQIA